VNLVFWQKKIRWILILVSVFLVGFLFWRDLAVSGKLEAEYNLKYPSPFITPLTPYDRLVEVKNKNERYFQSTIAEPVYFGVRLPRSFRQITFWVNFRSEPNEIFRLAAFADKDKEIFEINGFEEIKNIGEGWQEGRVTFDMTNKNFNFQKYQFMFSAPQLKIDGHEVDISKIKILAEREPLTWAGFWEKVWGRIIKTLK